MLCGYLRLSLLKKLTSLQEGVNVYVKRVYLNPFKMHNCISFSLSLGYIFPAKENEVELYANDANAASHVKAWVKVMRVGTFCDPFIQTILDQVNFEKSFF
jgi:hypothetical protein